MTGSLSEATLTSSATHALYAEVNGEGPPLILLHGWGLNLRVWDSLMPQLTEHFRVVAIDLPGHGRSGWPGRAQTLIEHAQLVSSTYQLLASKDATLSTQGVNVLGWSFGGQVALSLASLSAKEAIPVRRLILTATSPKFAASADWPQGLSPPVLASFARQLETDYRQTVSDFLELQTRGSTNSTEVLAVLRNALFTHGEAQREALTEGFKILASSDLRSWLPKIQQSTLVIAGQYDRVTPPAAGKALADHLPHAQYLEIRRAGHAPFLSHPDTFMAALFNAQS